MLGQFVDSFYHLFLFILINGTIIAYTNRQYVRIRTSLIQSVLQTIQ